MSWLRNTSPGRIAWCIFAGVITHTSASAQPWSHASIANNEPRYGVFRTYNSWMTQPDPLHAIGGSPCGVAVADLNGDDTKDLVLCNADFHPDIPGSLAIALNRGDGFTQLSHGITNLMGMPQDVQAADLDGDGDQDLVTVLYLDGQACIFLNNGDATFEAAGRYEVGLHPKSLRLADMNGDGRPDLLVLNAGDVPWVKSTLSLLLNQGDGAFGPQQSVNIIGVPTGPLTPWPGAFFDTGDVDADGDLDVMMPSQGWVRMAINDGAGQLTLTPLKLEGASTSYAVAVSDLDQDGDPDVVSAAMNSSKLSLFFNQGGSGAGWLGFDKVQVVDTSNPLYLGSSDAITSVAMGDYNGDGYPDIALSAWQLWGMLILINRGADAPGSFHPVEFRSSTESVWMVQAADMNDDGLDDVIAFAMHFLSGIATHLSLPGKPVYAGEQNVLKMSDRRWAARCVSLGGSISTMTETRMWCPPTSP